MFGLVGGEGTEVGWGKKKSNYKILPKKNNEKTEMSYVNSVCGPMTTCCFFVLGCATMTVHKQLRTCHLTVAPYPKSLPVISSMVPLMSPQRNPTTAFGRRREKKVADDLTPVAAARGLMHHHVCAPPGG